MEFYTKVAHALFSRVWRVLYYHVLKYGFGEVLRRGFEAHFLLQFSFVRLVVCGL